MTLPAEADVRLLISRLVSGAAYRWKSNDGSVGTLADIDWRDGRAEPTEAEFEAEWIVLLAERTVEGRTKNDIDAAVDLLAGRTVRSLSDAERVTLLEGVLFKLGGVANDRNVQPAAKWLDRR